MTTANPRPNGPEPLILRTRTRVPPAIAAFGQWLSSMVEKVIPILDATLEAVIRVENERPPNWPTGLTTLVRARPLLRDGIPIVWTPDPVTLNLLTAAPSGLQRQAVLIDRARHAVEHSRQVLTEVTCPALEFELKVVSEALSCVLDYPIAAQALALQTAPLLAMTLHDMTSTGALHAHASDLNREGPLPPAGTLKAHLTTIVFATVLARFNPKDPVPATPNRHAVAHTLAPEQYTRSNAVSATLLAVSVLRQLQAEHNEHGCVACSAPTAGDPQAAAAGITL